MALILFTSEDYIKTYTPISELVDWSDIEPTVHLTQDSFIQDVLGSNFYTYLQIAYSGQSLNTNEIELMNKIKPALAYRVAEQTLPFINYQIKNKGVVSQTGDYMAAVDLETFRYLRGELKNKAEFYTKRLSNYLCTNAQLFPEYVSDNADDMKPNKSGYDCGLAFWL